MDLHQIFKSKGKSLNKKPQNNSLSNLSSGTPPLFFEQLEPRLLLSGDFAYAALPGQALDLTLRLQDDGINAPVIQIVDNASSTVVAEKLVAETTQVIINGDELDDKLTIDLSNPIDVPIEFDGGNGNDTVDFVNNNVELDYLENQDGSTLVTDNSGLSAALTDVENVISGNNFSAIESGLLLASGLPDITNISSNHDDFRFIGNMAAFESDPDVSLVPVYNTYQASISGSVNSVDFSFGDWTIPDNDGSDGWSATFDMNNVTATQLKVTAKGPNGEEIDQETENENILLLPDWFYEGESGIDGSVDIFGKTIELGDIIKSLSE